jgi:hypothetical protein
MSVSSQDDFVGFSLGDPPTDRRIYGYTPSAFPNTQRSNPNNLENNVDVTNIPVIVTGNQVNNLRDLPNGTNLATDTPRPQQRRHAIQRPRQNLFVQPDVDDSDESNRHSVQRSSRSRTTNKQLSVKIPQFYKKNPPLWFIQLETCFSINNIVEDNIRYKMVVASLDAVVLEQVSDVVLSPPNMNQYETLKSRILERFADSDGARLKKLLTGLSLGDKRPSHLLREMKELAGSGIGDRAIKSLWLQRLPSQTQAILSVCSVNTDQLAIMADKICEVNTGEACAASSSFESTNPFLNSLNSASSSAPSTEYDLLLKKLDALETKFSNLLKSRSKSRSRFPQRQRSSNRNNNKGLCFYHDRFAERALKCIKPCAYVPSNQGN